MLHLDAPIELIIQPQAVELAAGEEVRDLESPAVAGLEHIRKITYRSPASTQGIVESWVGVSLLCNIFSRYGIPNFF